MTAMSVDGVGVRLVSKSAIGRPTSCRSFPVPVSVALLFGADVAGEICVPIDTTGVPPGWLPFSLMTTFMEGGS